jgi:hypothetical protein
MQMGRTSSPAASAVNCDGTSHRPPFLNREERKDRKEDQKVSEPKEHLCALGVLGGSRIWRLNLHCRSQFRIIYSFSEVLLGVNLTESRFHHVE